MLLLVLALVALMHKKVKQSHYRPGQALRVQEVEAPRFQDSRHMKVARLSALRTVRLYPSGNIPGTHFYQRLSQPQGHSAAGRITSMKNSIDIIGNRNRNLPACSALRQPLRHRGPIDRHHYLGKPLFFIFLGSFTSLLPWRMMQHVRTKRRYLFTELLFVHSFKDNRNQGSGNRKPRIIQWFNHAGYIQAHSTRW
jgi:hypothetical protein